MSQPARKRGRQTGQQAPQRRGYEHLPVVEELIVLPAEQCLCDKCGAPRMAQGTEDSEQIEIEVQAHRRKFRRQRYRRSCQCPDEPVTSIAPLPEKLLPKGILGTSVFVDVLISKYQVHQPVERWLLEWRQNDLDLAKGTVFDGLRRIEPLLAPIHQAILQRAAAAEVSQADETRWLMFAEVEGKASHQWWMWAFLKRVCQLCLARFVTSCQNEVRNLRNVFLGTIMDDVPQVKSELLMPVVREQIEEAVRKIMEAVNAAPAGALIAASEEAVRDITGQLRRQLFEAALQQRINAAEAAFPPSGGHQVRQEETQQGEAADHGADDQRTRESEANVVAFSGRRQRGSRRSRAVS